MGVNAARKYLLTSGEAKLGENVCGTLDGILLHQAEGGSDQEGKDSQSWEIPGSGFPDRVNRSRAYMWRDLRELIRKGTRCTEAVKTHGRGRGSKSPMGCTLHTVLSLQSHSDFLADARREGDEEKVFRKLEDNCVWCEECLGERLQRRVIFFFFLRRVIFKENLRTQSNSHDSSHAWKDINTDTKRGVSFLRTVIKTCIVGTCCWPVVCY